MEFWQGFVEFCGVLGRGLSSILDSGAWLTLGPACGDLFTLFKPFLFVHAVIVVSSASSCCGCVDF